jgi:protein-disulfide isomerase
MTQPITPARLFLTALLGGVLGGAAVTATAHWVGRDNTRDYLLEHPEVLPQVVERLKAKESEGALAQAAPLAQKVWPGAVLGNPAGKTVLVEFMDYACGYCRASEKDVARLLAGNPDLKLVIRQLPILSPQSADAAKLALAAAKQGKFAAFHHAMYAAGRLTPETMAEAAKAAGVDLALAQKQMAEPATQAEIEGNLTLARNLGLNGTPSWIAGGQVLGGAVGYDALAKALGATGSGKN